LLYLPISSTTCTSYFLSHTNTHTHTRTHTHTHTRTHTHRRRSRITRPFLRATQVCGCTRPKWPKGKRRLLSTDTNWMVGVIVCAFLCVSMRACIRARVLSVCVCTGAHVWVDVCRYHTKMRLAWDVLRTFMLGMLTFRWGGGGPSFCGCLCPHGPGQVIVRGIQMLTCAACILTTIKLLQCECSLLTHRWSGGGPSFWGCLCPYGPGQVWIPGSVGAQGRFTA